MTALVVSARLETVVALVAVFAAGFGAGWRARRAGDKIGAGL